MSLRRASTMVRTESVRSKYFVKQEPVPNTQIGQNKQEFIKTEDNQLEIPKESPKESPKKRRKTNVKIEIKREDESDLLAKLTPSELEEYNDIDNLVTLNTAPKNWFEIYKHVKSMRSKIVAPVDTMGCAEIPNTLNKEIEDFPREIYRFQLLVSLILSSQTKDEINYKAMLSMKTYFQSVGHTYGITIDAINEVDEKKLDELIFSVGFHTRKASFLKRVVIILKEKYNNDIPNTLNGLVELPGVGPKMAYLTLQKAWDLNVGIGVDTHVDRLAKMWKWVDAKKCKTPEQTRIELEKWLPKEYWNPINPLLVGFGQVICQPRGRRCDLCSLSQTKLCSNVDRSLLKKVNNLSKEELEIKNKTIRGDISLLKDIEDLV